MLTAWHEVENALTAYQDEQLRRAQLIDAVAENRRRWSLAQSRYREGVADFLTVLDAERSLLFAQQQLAASTTTVSTNLVALYKALGGGWQNSFPVAGRTAGGGYCASVSGGTNARQRAVSRGLRGVALPRIGGAADQCRRRPGRARQQRVEFGQDAGERAEAVAITTDSTSHRRGAGQRHAAPRRPVPRAVGAEQRECRPDRAPAIGQEAADDRQRPRPAIGAGGAEHGRKRVQVGHQRHEAAHHHHRVRPRLRRRHRQRRQVATTAR